MKPISFIMPGRNNAKYAKWSYASIRKNLSPIHQICFADDFSDKDDTWAWCLETMKKDPNFNAIRNEGPTRLGHTILYDKLINEVSKNDICLIWHCDMYAIHGLDEEIDKLIKPKTLISLTRIEPFGLHPEGPEKILHNIALEPEEFNEKDLLEFAESIKSDKITEGIFAPWAFYKKDFQEIGGHDELYCPQSKEDSDIFNRFQLNDCKFIQTWRGMVAHLTCRGSRFNPTLTSPGKNSSEWEIHNLRSTKNFIRKWGSFVKHNGLLQPIVPKKYDVGFVMRNCNGPILSIMEPWCQTVYSDCDFNTVDSYIKQEQGNTKFDLKSKIKHILPNGIGETNSIIVKFDCNKLNNNNFQIIQNLSEILMDSGEVGKFEIDIFDVEIKSLNSYEKDLIICRNDGWRPDHLK